MVTNLSLEEKTCGSESLISIPVTRFHATRVITVHCTVCVSLQGRKHQTVPESIHEELERFRLVSYTFGTNEEKERSLDALDAIPRPWDPFPSPLGSIPSPDNR